MFGGVTTGATPATGLFNPQPTQQNPGLGQMSPQTQPTQTTQPMMGGGQPQQPQVNDYQRQQALAELGNALVVANQLQNQG